MNGSQWNKWNFHVHTKGTNKNDQFTSASMDAFFEVFFKKAFLKKVKAAGITDYFTIDRYLEAKQYVEQIETKKSENGEIVFDANEVEWIKNMFIFPNIELRMLPTTSAGKLINIHFLFNPEYVNELDNSFFNELENQDGIKMNTSGFIYYGKKMKPNVSPDLFFREGISHFVVDVKSITKVLAKNPGLRSNCLIVVSNSNKDGNSGLQKHYDLFDSENGSLDGVRRSIYRISNAIFSANPKDVNYFLGRRLIDEAGVTDTEKSQEIKRVISEQGGLKACLVGCDAHCENDLFLRHTWVKADLNFKGLKQIIYEPEQRVKIQEQEPDFKEDRLIIDSVKFICSKNQFTPKEIYLNKNLNVIIGGISSGKSILLYNIAKTLLADRTFLKKEDIEDKYKFGEDDKTYNFQVTTKGGFKQEMYRDNSVNSIIPEIKYIPQNYLVKLAEPNINKRGNALNKLVRELINEDTLSNSYYQEFISKVQSNDRKRESIIDNYFELRKHIETLENQLAQKASKEILLKNIETNTKKLEELNKDAGLREEEIEKYNGLQKQLEDVKLLRTKAGNDFTKITEFNREVNQQVIALVNRKNLISNSLENDALKKIFDERYLAIQQLSESIAETLTQFEIVKNESGVNVLKNQTAVSEVFKGLASRRTTIEDDLKPFQANEALKVQIEAITNAISTDKTAIQAIEQLNKEIQNNKIALATEKQKLFGLYVENYQEYQNIITELKPRTDRLTADGMNITGLIKYNFPKLRDAVYAISDGRSGSYNNYDIFSHGNDGLASYDFEKILHDVKKLFDDIVESNSYALTSKVDKDKKGVIKIILDDYFFDYWQIEYKNDKLGAMSTGKASFIILMLIVGLSQSKAPILIDQPEDNLDNRSITSDLVEYLRKKKLERQIILVTHNPNVVVNADAENIIIANQKRQNEEDTSSPYEFDYINGSLENSSAKDDTQRDLLKSMGIKEHIADIVEGGREAFIKREEKYGFSEKVIIV